MMHISFSQGCHPPLGCGEEEEDEGLRVKRSSTEALLTQLVSCRAAMHPYDPVSAMQDVSGCTAAIPDSLLRA